MEYKLSIADLRQIRNHYEKLEASYSRYFGYLANHDGWYIFDKRTRLPRLSNYEGFLSKLSMNRFTLFQTINAYKMDSDLWFDIPLVPGEKPDDPMKPNMKAMADKDSHHYMAVIDIDINTGEHMIEHQDVANNIVTFMKQYFKELGIRNVICNSGNGIYVIFPAAYLNVYGYTQKDKKILREAWGYFITEIQDEMFTNVPKAKGLFKVDNILNSNRQVKAIGSIHKSNGYIVLPVTEKLEFKRVTELTPGNYASLEQSIKFVQQGSDVDTTEWADLREIKDVLESKGYFEQAEKDYESKENYEPGRYETFDDEVSFETMNNCPLLYRIFSKDFVEQRPNHRAGLMAYYLNNLGYSEKRMFEIIESYGFSKVIVADAIRLCGSASAPNYKTVINKDTPYPGAGCRTDYGNIRIPEGYKNPIQLIKDVIRAEEKLTNAVEDLVYEDNTTAARKAVKEASCRMLRDNNKALNTSPPRVGKTHSIIEESLKNGNRPTLIFGESHEQLSEMGAKFPDLYHWYGKRELCIRQEEFEKFFESGVNPCGFCAEDMTTCKWKIQLEDAKDQKHILINKQNIENGIARMLKTQGVNILIKGNDGYDIKKKHRSVIFDENLNEVIKIDYVNIPMDALNRLYKFLKRINDQKEGPEKRDIYGNIVNMGIEGYEYITKDLTKLPLHVLEMVHTGLTESGIRRAMSTYLKGSSYDVMIDIISTMNTLVDNLTILIHTKSNGYSMDFNEPIFLERSLVDMIDPDILLDATPSPNMNTEEYTIYNVHTPLTNSIIIRPKRGENPLTYAKETASYHLRNKEKQEYIEFVEEQILYCEQAGLSVGLVTYKGIKKEHGKDDKFEIEEYFLAQGIDVLHYGGVRGMSSLDNKDVLIMLGTWKPTVDEIYPEYRYRGGKKGYNEINALYREGNVITMEDGSKRRITGDELFDKIAMHNTEAEMEQAMLRNMAHIKTRIIIAISSIPQSLQNQNTIEFNWLARDHIQWTKLYNQYKKAITKTPISIKTVEEPLTITNGITRTREIKRTTKNSKRKEADAKLYEKVMDYYTRGKALIEIYDMLSECNGRWKTYSGFHKWLKKYEN